MIFTSFLATTADCGPPPFLLNGAVRYQNTTEGSEGRYQCNDGFTLEGRRTTVCRANGSWDCIPNCRPQRGKLTISLMACKMYTYIKLTSDIQLWYTNRGGSRGGAVPPPSGLSPHETWRFATRLAHIATLMQCTSLYESQLHVLHT